MSIHIVPLRHINHKAQLKDPTGSEPELISSQGAEIIPYVFLVTFLREKAVNSTVAFQSGFKKNKIGSERDLIVIYFSSGFASCGG